MVLYTKFGDLFIIYSKNKVLIMADAKGGLIRRNRPGMKAEVKSL